MKIMKQVKKTFTSAEGRVSGAVGAGTVLVIGVGVSLWANNDFNKRLAEAEAKAKEEGTAAGHETGLKEGHDAGYKEGHDAGYKEGHEKGVIEGMAQIDEGAKLTIQAYSRENMILNQMVTTGCSRQEAEVLVSAMIPPMPPQPQTPPAPQTPPTTNA